MGQARGQHDDHDGQCDMHECDNDAKRREHKLRRLLDQTELAQHRIDEAIIAEHNDRVRALVGDNAGDAVGLSRTIGAGRLACRDRAILESLISIRRAGADFTVTYFAKEAARLLA